ncbi:MAG: hypothetical protein AUJ51_02745 [Elusimicrobia bacterium CG1_02_56_21]|nr:MAG: hypothetical protein AUJ51_02745 [Elusimicrobia bacterium CG1_02_56_21]
MINRKNIYQLLGILPLLVFLRVTRWYGFTYRAWELAFLTGAALTSAVLALSAWRKVPVRDIVLASSLMLLSGGLGFLTGQSSLTGFYSRWQGSIFIAWYLAVRAGLALAPELSDGLVYDPYAVRPKLASALAVLALVWSLFHKDLLVSVALPMSLATAGLTLACRKKC